MVMSGSLVFFQCGDCRILTFFNTYEGRSESSSTKAVLFHCDRYRNNF